MSGGRPAITDEGQGTSSQDDRASEFARQAESAQGGLLREYVAFLKQNKKWWLLPILIALLLVTVLIVLGSTAAAPFIYTLF